MSIGTASTEDVAQLLEALAALAWPALALAALVIFRRELVGLLGRVVKGRIGPLEVELREAKSSAEAAEASTSGPPDTAETDRATPAEPLLDLTRDPSAPKATLIALSAEIERRLREVLSTRAPTEATSASFQRHIQLLDLSPALRHAADEFRTVRNRIVHGGDATNDEVLRAIDIGVSLLRAINQVPHEVNVVLEPKVECFADPDGQSQHDFQAVVLVTEGGEEKSRAFPHTGAPLPKDQPVTWEWISGRVFPESWYRDPRTGELQYGWTESLEFAGRPLHS